MKAIDAKMLHLKEQGAGAKGYKGQVTKFVKRVEKASKQSNRSSFQEAHVCNNNLKGSCKATSRHSKA